MLEAWPLTVGYACPWEHLVRPGGSWQRMALPARCLLLRHPQQGVHLWDSGYGAAYIRATASWPARILRWLIPADLSGPGLRDQIRSVGLEPDEVRSLLLSHYHPDHLGSVSELPGVPVYGSSREWERIQRSTWWQRQLHGYLDGLLCGLKVLPIEGWPQQVWPGWEELGPGYDWFGDGSARIFQLPGHTRGQLGLWVDRSPRPLFMVSDAYYLPEELEGHPLPWLTRRAIEDPAGHQHTLNVLRRLRERHPQVEFLSSHQPEDSRTS